MTEWRESDSIARPRRPPLTNCWPLRLIPRHGPALGRRSACFSSVAPASRVAENDRVIGEAEDIVEALRTGPTAAQGKAARLVRTAKDHSLLAQPDEETGSIVARARTPDAEEGHAPFLNEGRRISRASSSPPSPSENSRASFDNRPHHPAQRSGSRTLN